jgi:uncharacterized protein with predicted RNA binding PUA domain
LTIYGADLFLKNKSFVSNCIVPVDEAVPFVSEGRSLFIRHVYKCGENVKNGSDVAVIDPKGNHVLAVGRSLFPFSYYVGRLENPRSLLRGVAVKNREGIKSRTT